MGLDWQRDRLARPQGCGPAVTGAPELLAGVKSENDNNTSVELLDTEKRSKRATLQGTDRMQPIWPLGD